MMEAGGVVEGTGGDIEVGLNSGLKEPAPLIPMGDGAYVGVAVRFALNC